MAVVTTYSLSAGPQFLASFPNATTDQFSSTIAARSDGTFTVAYDNAGSSWGVGAQWLQANGNVIATYTSSIETGSPVVNAIVAGDQDNSSIATFGDGRQIVVYEDSSAGNANSSIRARVLNTDGTLGADYLVASGASSDLSRPDVAVLANGQAIITFTRTAATSDNDILSFRATATGLVAGSLQVIDSAPSRNTTQSSVAALTDGGFAVAYQNTSGSGIAPWIAVLNADGTVRTAPTEVQGTGTSRKEISAVGLPNGGFALAYDENSYGDQTNSDITLEIFSAAGSRLYSANANRLTGPGTNEPGNQTKASVTVLSNGLPAVTWRDFNANGDVYGAVFTTFGQRLTTPAVIADLPNSVFSPTTAGLLNGAFVVTYNATGVEPTGSSFGVAAKVMQLTRSTTGDADPNNLYLDNLPDVVSTLGGSDVVFSGGGNDVIFLGDGNDAAAGQRGDDVIYGGAGTEYLYGGEGTDTIFGEGDTDFLFGEGGNDALYGGAGTDGIAGGVGNDYLFGEAGTDYLYGDAGNDYLYGGAEFDFVYGGDGVDALFGEGGGDLLAGEGDTDYIAGGDGDDYIFGGDGVDFLYGDGGNDTYFGGLGAPDAFYHTAGSGGNDAMMDWESLDVLVLLGTGYGSREQVLAQASFGGGNIVINTGAGTSVTLYGVAPGNLGVDNIILG